MRTMSPARSITVLLVEDNPRDAHLVEDAFERVSDDIEIHTVADGAEALGYLSDRRGDSGEPFPDLLLLDLNVPRVHGFEVLEALQADSTLATLPVLVLTCSDDRADIAESYDRCANAYLTKPSSHDEFLSLARAVEEFWVKTAHLPPVSAA